jgi:hypothetical protein
LHHDETAQPACELGDLARARTFFSDPNDGAWSDATTRGFGSETARCGMSQKCVRFRGSEKAMPAGRPMRA